MSGSYDLLLDWVSEKGEGTWPEFKNAWSWISGREELFRPDDPAAKAWIAASKLAALGHLEITWGDGGQWAATPPVLTMLPNSGGRALLTGARTRTLYQPALTTANASGLLADQAEELDLWIDDVNGRGHERPTSVLVACNTPQDAAELASRCGIDYSYSVSSQLSALLPALQAYTKLWRPGGLPEGFPIEAFDPDSLTWYELERDQPSDPGLYRCRTFRDHVHVLIPAIGGPFRVGREHGVYEVLRWTERAVLSYDPAERELWVPVNAGLPVLHERAAVLCSGQLSEFRSKDSVAGRVYANVGRAVASRIAASLSQRLDLDA